MLKVFRISIFIIVLLFKVTCSVYGQPNFMWFQNFSFEKGLPFNKECFTLFQDDKGFIWMGSDVGLHRFDGKFFRNYLHVQNDSTSLRKGFVNTIFCDSKNAMWIGTSEGADIFFKETGRFIHVPMHNSADNIEINQSVRGFFENEKGELFLHTHFYIYQFNPEKQQFIQILHDINQIQPESFVIERIIQENDYLICATNNQGLIIYNPEGVKIKVFDKKYLESNTLRDVYKSSIGQLWVATDKGLNVADNLEDLLNEKSKGFEKVRDAGGVFINRITEDRKGNIWAVTDGEGIFEVNPKSLKITKTKHNADLEGTILSNKPSLVFIDVQNNLWSFYNNLGFSIASLSRTNIFNTFVSKNPTGNGPSGNIITAFAQDKAGNIWIGTDGDGLNLFDRNQFSFQHFKHKSGIPAGISSDVILSLFIDSEDQLWIGTYNGGLCKFNKSSGRFIVYRNDENNSFSLSSNNVSAITEGDDGKLYILTISNGLNILDKKTNRFQRIHNDVSNPFKLSHNGGTSLLKDSQGNIWIGTYWGLNCMDTKTSVITKYFFNPSDSGSINSNIINSIFEDSDKNIWIATPNGLNLYSKESNSFTGIGKTAGLAGQHITSVIEDNEKKLWLGTLNGIWKMDRVNGQIKHFGINYNLPGKILLPRSVLKTRNGEIFFGGNRGFTFINPDMKIYTDFLPKLYFTELSVLDKTIIPCIPINNHKILTKDITYTEKLIFNYREKSFSLAFSALDYANESKVQYYYQLEGFDESWRMADNSAPKATYTNLDAGSYRLLVKLVSGLDETVSSPLEMKIVILPPIWLRWWAILLYFAIVALLAAFFIQITLARIRLKRTLILEKIQHEKDTEISRMKEEFYMQVTHEFRTPLTLILGPVETLIEKYSNDNFLTGQLQLLKRNATRLILLINELLDFGKIENLGLKISASELNIVDYIKQVAFSFESQAQIHNIDFQVNVEKPEIFVWFDSGKLDKVFYNLLSNAFKFTHDYGLVHCNIKTKNGFVSIEIADDGIGINEKDLQNIFRKYFSQSYNGQTGTGIGLYLSNEIVKLHRGTLTAKNNADKGTTVEVSLPLGNNHFSENELIHSDYINSKYLPEKSEIENEVLVSGSGSQNQEVSEIEKPLILLVEDNSDVRSFVKNILEHEYEIIEAENGKLGLDLAFEFIPDLVISDIMLPMLDGRSLCKLLKNDIRTSHIPIIMLTALAGIEDKIKGLDLGADSYIAKPFHPRHLTVRIKKLLELRKLLYKKFNSDFNPEQKGLKYEPNEILNKSADEQFIQKLIDIVEKHISDSNFEIDDLSSELGMNYLQLYRKVKAITNLSIKQFILTIRMKTAAKMIETRKFNISEVAYDVGFSSPAYFSESFKKYFGMTPKEYLQRRT